MSSRLSLLVSVSVVRRSSFGGVVISPARFGCSSHPPPLLYRPLLHQPRYLSAPPTPQILPPRPLFRRVSSNLLFLVCSCCMVVLAICLVRLLGRSVVVWFCVLRYGAAVLLWELRCCAAVRLCCCVAVLLRWPVLRVLCVSCLVLVWGACVSSAVHTNLAEWRGACGDGDGRGR